METVAKTKYFNDEDQESGAVLEHSGISFSSLERFLPDALERAFHDGTQYAYVENYHTVIDCDRLASAVIKVIKEKAL